MSEPLYYRLAEVEELLRYSRDTVARFIAAGLLVAQGSGKGRRVTVASVRALERRLAAGEDVWQIVRARTKATNVAAEPSPIAKDRSIRIKMQTPLTLAQSHALLDAVAGHRLALLYHLALLLGLRKGELLGSLWNDFDAAAGTLKITGQVQTIAGKTERSDSPKSEASRRTLPLPRATIAMVQALWTAQQQESQRLGVAFQAQGLMFPSEAGTPIIPRNLSRHWYGLLRNAQLPPLPFHILRHTAATRLDEEGASEAVKAAILGHGHEVLPAVMCMGRWPRCCW